MAVVGLVAEDGGDPQAGETAYRDHPQFQDFLSYLCLKNLSETTIDGYIRILPPPAYATHVPP
jgi:hypothetical protein